MKTIKIENKVLIIIVVVILAVTVVKDIICKSLITTVGASMVGAPIKISYLAVGLFSQKIRIKNFKLYNPSGFPSEPVLEIPEIQVDYDLGALLGGKIHLPLLVFNLKEMVVVKNKEGKLNVDSFKMIEEHKKEAKVPAKEMAMQIDVLKLNVERVVFKDLTKEPMAVQVYEVALRDKEFKNIDNVPQLITLILVQAMAPTAIHSAKMYAAATILGVGFLPAGVIGVMVGKDSASGEFKLGLDRVYSEALKVIKQMGEVKSEDRGSGIIQGKVNGADITAKVESTTGKKTTVTVSARQMLIPKREIADGIIYQLKKKLK